MRMRRIVMCDIFVSTVFSHISSETVRFSKKSYWTSDMCDAFLYNFCQKHFSIKEELSEIW